MHRFLPILAVLGLLFVMLTIKPAPPSVPQDGNSQIAVEDGGFIDPRVINQATGVFDSAQTIAYYDSHQVAYPSSELAKAADEKNSQVLGATDSQGKEKWIEVDLAKQQLTAWEGNDIYLQYPISSGLFFPTPTGTFNIYWKIRYIRMKGGDPAKGDFYDLPNVPDTMFFYQGYGIHGAYWHHNFGHPMSHGCINEPLDKAHELFEWAGPRINPDQSSVTATADNPGSRVWVH